MGQICSLSLFSNVGIPTLVCAMIIDNINTSLRMANLVNLMWRYVPKSDNSSFKYCACKPKTSTRHPYFGVGSYQIYHCCNIYGVTMSGRIENTPEAGLFHNYSATNSKTKSKTALNDFWDFWWRRREIEELLDPELIANEGTHEVLWDVSRRHGQKYVIEGDGRGKAQKLKVEAEGRGWKGVLETAMMSPLAQHKHVVHNEICEKIRLAWLGPVVELNLRCSAPPPSLSRARASTPFFSFSFLSLHHIQLFTYSPPDLQSDWTYFSHHFPPHSLKKMTKKDHNKSLDCSHSSSAPSEKICRIFLARHASSERALQPYLCSGIP